jgi:hypothetical protein
LKQLTTERRITLVRKTIVLFFLAGILMSFHLWVADRTFPLLPVSDALLFLHYPFDYILAFLLMAGLCLGFFFEKKIIAWTTLVLLTFLLLQDQNRLQAWVYMYALLLALFVIPGKSSRENILTGARIIIAGIYIWSGIHKLNPNFIDVTFQNILVGLFGIKSESLIAGISPFGYCIPVLEIAAGLFLLFPKFRNASVWMILATHIFILVYLSPIGINTNSVVYPWNIAMMALVFLLFYGTKDKLELNRKPVAGIIATILVAWVLPSLNFFGLWDHYLSFSYYSSKPSLFYIIVSDEECDKIDPSLSTYFVPANKIQGGKILDINKWALAEMNVPFYPQNRVFKILGRSFCDDGIEEAKIFFLELPPPLKEHNYIQYSCDDFK